MMTEPRNDTVSDGAHPPEGRIARILRGQKVILLFLSVLLLIVGISWYRMWEEMGRIRQVCVGLETKLTSTQEELGKALEKNMTIIDETLARQNSPLSSGSVTLGELNMENETASVSVVAVPKEVNRNMRVEVRFTDPDTGWESTVDAHRAEDGSARYTAEGEIPMVVETVRVEVILHRDTTITALLENELQVRRNYALSLMGVSGSGAYGTNRNGDDFEQYFDTNYYVTSYKGEASSNWKSFRASLLRNGLELKTFTPSIDRKENGSVTMFTIPVRTKFAIHDGDRVQIQVTLEDENGYAYLVPLEDFIFRPTGNEAVISESDRGRCIVTQPRLDLPEEN